MEIPLPRYVQRVHCDLDQRFPPGTQVWDFTEKTHVLRWRFKKLQGGVDCSLKARLTLERPYGAALRTEVRRRAAAALGGWEFRGCLP